MTATPYPAGAFLREDGTTFFRVWAPAHSLVELCLDSGLTRMKAAKDGYFELAAAAPPGARYSYRLSGTGPFPDPASLHQPEGVDGPSAVVDNADLAPHLDWESPPPEDYVIYEMHVGAFTEQGRFSSAIAELPRLRELGITAVEIMPVAQFSGRRNWGYDGVFPYAVQNSYGGPDAMKQFVRACHRNRLAVILDVVYNHVGPEGCCMDRFGPYFRTDYSTPWGPGINFDGPDSRPVRDFFLANAEMWIREFRVDALRVDAIDTIGDSSSPSFSEELTRRVRKVEKEIGRKVLLFAETDSGSRAYARASSQGGVGMDAQWANSFHHAIHCRLTGEREGYFRYWGSSSQIADCFRHGFQGFCSRRPIDRVPGEDGASVLHPTQMVVFNQNHDLIGNRLSGDRASARLSSEQLRLCAAALLLSPFTPLIFMGEEYAETAPFHYFVDFAAPSLREEVKKGRLREFSDWNWSRSPADPCCPRTFERSRLRPELRDKPAHRAMEDFYRRLIELRHRGFGFKGLAWQDLNVGIRKDLICIRSSRSLLLLNFGERETACSQEFAAGNWLRILDTNDAAWGGPGARAQRKVRPPELIRSDPYSAALFERE